MCARPRSRRRTDLAADAARRATEFILAKMYDPPTGILLRRYRQGDAAIHGFLDDYGFFVKALLDRQKPRGCQLDFWSVTTSGRIGYVALRSELVVAGEVVRMDVFTNAANRNFRGGGIHFEDAIGFGRPEMLIGVDVRPEAADVRNPLRMIEQAVGAIELGFDPLAIREWLASLYDRDLDTMSIRRKLAAVRGLFRFLQREGEIAGNPDARCTAFSKRSGSCSDTPSTRNTGGRTLRRACTRIA